MAAIAHMIELPLYIGAVMYLSEMYGVVGAAIAWSLRVTVDFFIFHQCAFRAIKGHVQKSTWKRRLIGQAGGRQKH